MRIPNKKYPCGVFFYLVGAHSIPSHGAMRRLRGNRNDLTARVLVKSTCFRTGNVRCRLRTVATNQKQKRHKGVLIFGWGARIRTMIKRTKISCPTIRRHPKSNTDYKYLLRFCNNIFTIMHIKAKKIKKFIIFPLAFCLLKTIIIQVFNN